MTRSVVVADPTLEGVTYVSVDASQPRPHWVVISAVHGNERCGVHAAERLLAQFADGTLTLERGTLTFVNGNPSAEREGLRHTPGGADLNRLFGYDFLESLPRERWTSEHTRAAELRPIMEDADALLDLHSATSPTPPFAIVNPVPAARDLARRLGFTLIASGWDAPGLLMDKVTIGVLARKARPGVSVECGQHEDPRSIDVAEACALAFLRAIGAIDGQAQPTEGARFVHVVGAIGRPSAGFRFVRAIRGMTPLNANELIGCDELCEVRVLRDCWAVLPNDGVAVGQDMIYLAVEEAAS